MAVGENRQRRKTTKTPTINQNRKQWLRTDSVEFINYVMPEGEAEGEGSQDGWGQTSILWMSRFRGGGNRTNLSFELTEFTKEELEAVRHFINLLLDEAQETVELRDRLAREAMEDGNDTYTRLYRQVPKLTQRKGAVRKHSEGEDG